MEVKHFPVSVFCSTRSGSSSRDVSYFPTAVKGALLLNLFIVLSQSCHHLHTRIAHAIWVFQSCCSLNDIKHDSAYNINAKSATSADKTFGVVSLAVGKNWRIAYIGSFGLTVDSGREHDENQWHAPGAVSLPSYLPHFTTGIIDKTSR
jgi:hypothetical protein